MRLLLPLVLLSSPFAEAQDRGTLNNAIQGCWELVGGSGFRKSERCLKFIAGTRETWVIYDVKTKEPKESAGGSFHLVGDTFTIKFEYATLPKYRHFLRKPFTYRYVRTGDILRITEERDGATRLDQQWKLCE